MSEGATAADRQWLDEAFDRLLADGPRAFEALRTQRPDLAATLEELAASIDDARGSGRPTPSLELKDWQPIRELGVGSMGRVLLAIEPGVAGRPVALKLLHGHLLESPSARGRIRREIAALARLDHEAILPVLAAVRDTDDDVVGYAMPIVRGASLGDVLAAVAERGPAEDDPVAVARARVRRGAARVDRHLPPTGGTSEGRDHDVAAGLLAAPNWTVLVCRIGEVIAGALATAHAVGLVHRDVKPENILLDEEGRVRLADFGLVAADETEGRRSGRLTATGQFLGTRQYAAPEQRQSDRGRPIGPPADVYGLGATLRHALAVVHGGEWAGTRASRAAAASVSRDLETLIQVSMEPAAANRPTAADLAADLARVQRLEPITARPVPQVRRAIRWASRHRPAAMGFAAGACLMIALAGLAAWLVIAAPRQGVRLERVALASLFSEQFVDVIQAGAFWMPRNDDGTTRYACRSTSTASVRATLDEAIERLEPALALGRGTPWRTDLMAILEIAAAIVSPPLGELRIPASLRRRRPTTAAYADALIGWQRRSGELASVSAAEVAAAMSLTTGPEDQGLSALLAFLVLDFEAADEMWARSAGSRDGRSVELGVRALHEYVRGEPGEAARFAQRARIGGIESTTLLAIELESLVDAIVESELRTDGHRDRLRREWEANVRERLATAPEDTARRVRLLAGLLDPVARAASLDEYRRLTPDELNPMLVADAAIALEAAGDAEAAFDLLVGSLWYRLGSVPMLHDVLRALLRRAAASGTGGEWLDPERPEHLAMIVENFGGSADRLAFLQAHAASEWPDDGSLVLLPQAAERLRRLDRRRTWLEREIARSSSR